MHARWIIRAVSAVVTALATTIVLAPLTAGADTSQQYPVPWDFITEATLSAAQNGPDVPPPGATDPSSPCPAGTLAAHPNPVVLVHGLLANENDNWQTISPFLADNGYCVYALTYGNMASNPPPFNMEGGLTDMTASANVLAGFVQQVLADNPGTSKVDIVGHSEGGTMPDWYLKFDSGAAYVAHFVAISGVMHGTTLGVAGALYSLGQSFGFSDQLTQTMSQYCASCLEFMPTSPWMTTLDNPNAAGEAGTCPYDGAAVEGVNYTSLATNNDELVRPPTSDFINTACNGYDGILVANILVQNQCPTDQADHLSMASDPVVAEDILNALDPGSVPDFECAVVLPSVGQVVPVGG